MKETKCGVKYGAKYGISFHTGDTLLGLFNGSGLVLAQLHQTVVHLLHNLGMGVSGGVLSSLGVVFDLFLDPEVGLFESILDLDGGLPSQLFHDQLVVGVAATHTHGSVNVLDGEFLVLEREGNLGKLNHVHHFGGAQVDGDVAVGEGETQDTFDAVIDKGEGASLLAITPHFKVLGTGDGLAAESGGSLFTAALPGSTRSVNVVETGDANVHVKVTSVGESHFFGVQLFQAVHVLGAGRPGIGFNETGVGRVFLLGFVVDTGRRGVEKVLDAVTTGGFEHVHGDGGVVKGEDGLVGDDESHATHISSQVVDLRTSFTGFAGDFQLAQVIVDELVAELVVLHEFVRLPVDHCGVWMNNDRVR